VAIQDTAGAIAVLVLATDSLTSVVTAVAVTVVVMAAVETKENTMGLPKVLLWINCVLFILFGLAFALTPQWFATLLTGASPSTSSGVTDMRAVYGGVALALAYLFAQCAANNAYTKLGVQNIVAVMIGLATARSLGIALDSHPNVMMHLLLASEIIMALLAIFAIRRMSV
jgi:hypothetical protein